MIVTGKEESLTLGHLGGVMKVRLGPLQALYFEKANSFERTEPKPRMLKGVPGS